MRRRIASTGTGPRVTCRITPFGTDGPLADWRGNELVYQALAGPMYENGRPEGPPLFGVGHRASYAAASSATSKRSRRSWDAGVPRSVDVAIAEVAASMSFNRVTQFSYNGEIEGRDIRTIPRAIAALRRRLGQHLHLRQPLAAGLPRAWARRSRRRPALPRRGLAAPPLGARSSPSSSGGSRRGPSTRSSQPASASEPSWRGRWRRASS